MAGELGQQTVELGAVVRRAAEDSYLALRELVEKSRVEAEGKNGQQRSDTEKKIDLLKFIDRTRQRMLRLHVLAKWCQQVPLVHYCQQLASTLSSHETCFTQTADSLFFMHEGLQQARAPIFDVPSAIEVLHTGSYRRVPKCVEEIGTQNTLFQDEQKPTLKKLSTLVRAKLLEISLPKEISEVSVTDGIANVQVDGEFKVLITLGYRGHFSLWRILHMELLVGEKAGPIKLEETRRYALGDDIERRMAVADNPFMILYTILHELCISLVMDTVIRQTNVLRQGRWKDAIKSELISDIGTGQGGSNAVMQLGQDGELDSSGSRIPGLKINYWLEEKNNASAESDSSPYIKIEAGQDMQIKCQHSSFVLDPFTDKEADLSIDLSCIDVEALILKAIACNRHTRLLEIQRELMKNVQMSQSSTEVILKREVHGEGFQKRVHRRDSNDCCTNEMLQVRAYGQSYIDLGINIRNGRFLLQSLGNILPPSAVLDSEEALNKGSTTATDVFVSLRTRSILHLFAATGSSLGLKVYSQSQVTLKIPKSILCGSEFMVMGFPQCANAYYLLMQLDKSFKPVFCLLEIQSNEGDNNNADATTDAKEAIRFIRIDISKLKIDEDVQIGNFFDKDKLLALQNVEDRPQRQSGADEPLPARPSFFSIVDEVFRCDRGSPITESQRLPPNSLPSSHSSYQVGLHGFSGGAGSPDQDYGSLQSNINAAKVTSGTGLNNYLLSNSKNAQSTSAFSGSVPAGLGNVSSSRSEGAYKKRSLSEFLQNIPSSKQSIIGDGPGKRRKLSEFMLDGLPLKANSPNMQPRTSLTYGKLLEEVNNCITANIYSSVLLHVIKHCSICIKYAQLTAQMDSLNIPHVEEVGMPTSSSNLWLRLPFAHDASWKHICLHLGKAGSMSWDVRINDPHYGALWKLHGGSTTTEWGSGVRVANTSEVDSHISFDDDGVLLTYNTVEADSIQRLVSDLQRLSHARAFSCGMRRLIGVKLDGKLAEHQTAAETKLHSRRKASRDRLSEQMRKTFRIEAVGLMSLWFSYGAVPMVYFVVEWETGKSGCTMRVSPDQLWPHTKFLEDFVNGDEIASFLDCIRLTAGPLLALGGAIRPAKMPVTVPAGYSALPKQNNILTTAGSANSLSSSTVHNMSVPQGAAVAHSNSQLQTSSMLSVAGRTAPGLVPSSLLPFDVSVVLRGPYWIRIIYRNKFSVDMRCFAGDQVWLQPATPPKGGPSVGGSLPCPQFRPFIMEHVAQGLNALEPNLLNARHTGPPLNASANTVSGNQQLASAPNRFGGAPGVARPTSTVANQVASSLSRAGNAMMPSGFASGIAGAPAHLSPGNVPAHMKGELNTAFIGLGDDGGYGGGWVPLAALKKVLRGILKYLGVLWLFAQLPDLLKEILGSVLKDNEGALLNLDHEQPALRFFVGGYVFAVSVHRVQLLLQVLNVKRFHHQQQQQQQTPQNNGQEELTVPEISEICDYFSRRVASEPYDASRVASFITLLTLPISVLREFIKLIAWKKSLPQAHADNATTHRARIEICLEKHPRLVSDDYTASSSSSKSNIHHDRANNSVDFALTFVLDQALVPHMSISGGAAWLPYCVSVRVRYTFGEDSHIAFLAMDGSHSGRACWLQHEDWERCKQRVSRAVETMNGSAAVGDMSQGRLRMVAEMVQKQLQLSLLQLRDSPVSTGSAAS
uniref:Mediator of RNA polymerase II transcription subunit 14 n=1 Tax=Oryza nivara TaxID=4536 RepID=A0A0E0IAE3_ORYNI